MKRDNIDPSKLGKRKQAGQSGLSLDDGDDEDDNGYGNDLSFIFSSKKSRRRKKTNKLITKSDLNEY